MTRLATTAVALAALLAAAAPARAQDPGTEVGGTVPQYLGLELDQPEGFATFPGGPGEYELSVRARVTATGARAALSVADGDATSGSGLGRMASSASRLAAPLEARVGSTAFLPLDAAFDPLLTVLRGPVANELVTVRLRQRIGGAERPRGTYSKTLLITLSANAP